MKPRPIRKRDRFYETTEFVTLNREWQGKLADSGFVDLEDDFPVAHRRDLRTTVYRDREVARRGEDSGLVEYMRRCGRWLHERVWPTLSRLRMWELFCEGVPRGELVERMGTLPGHQSWYVGAQLAEERAMMEAWYAAGGDPPDGRVLSLLDQELEANGDFRHVRTRGEGGGDVD